MENVTKKKKLVILFGGRSSEYDVSLRSVTSVLENLDRDKYEITTIGITREGDWYLYTGEPSKITDDTWHESSQVKPAFITPSRAEKGIMVLTSDNTYVYLKADVILSVIHGQDGEDGKIQGLFEMSGIPYVGCNPAASVVCMDKYFTHIILESVGIKMAKWVVVERKDRHKLNEIKEYISKELNYPVFIKPANSGSSVGVNMVSHESELEKAMDIAFEEDKKILIEEAVPGKEVECAVLGNGHDLIASPLGQIVSQVFYDYESKYENDSAELIIPAEVESDVSDKVRETAKKAFTTLGCDGLSRVDFFVTPENEVVLNEINTMPGFTSISMYSKLIEEYGIPYSEMLDRLIELGLSREEVRKLEK